MEWRRHFRKFHSPGLQIKFFISYCLSVSLLCGSVGLVYYKTTRHALYRLITKDAMSILQKNNQTIDQQLANIENYAHSFVADRALNDYLSQYQDARSVYDYYQLDRPITRLLHNYFSSSPSIFSAYVLTRRMSYGELFGSNIIPVQNFPESSTCQHARDGAGRTVWIPTYDFFQEYGQSSIPSEKGPYRDVFSAAKLIWETSDDYVILVINLLNDVYSQIFETQFMEYESSYLVLTPDRQIVCQSDAADPSFTQDLSVFDPVFLKGSGYTLLEFNGESFIVCYDTSRVTGWLSAWIIRQDTLVNQFTREMFQNLFVILILLILLPLLLILFINNKLIRPLDALQYGIRKTGKGDFKTVVKVGGFAEIRALIRSFNEANEKIDRLIKENYESQLLKKEAELAAYDYQLNPHFILNTLNLINLDLIQNGDDKLSETISSLSRIIEYTLRTRSLSVPFSVDLANTKNYLQIMEKRYKGRFTVEYKIDETMLSVQVPKLFLQPLAENSIRHGFEALDRQGRIMIRAGREGGLCIFEVEDNGCGFHPHALESILQKDSTHMGINNIRYRIRYLYGPEYGLTILLLSPYGTCIRITLPERTCLSLRN